MEPGRTGLILSGESVTVEPELTIEAATAAETSLRPLEERRAWDQIEFSVPLAIAGVADPEARPVAGQHDPAAKRLSIGGVEYWIRGLLRAPATLGAVVFVERCAAGPIEENELRQAFGLTPAEARVAWLLASRNSNREIAEALRVTQHTARRHTERVLLKLGVHRRTDVQRVLRTACPATCNSGEDAYPAAPGAARPRRRVCHKRTPPPPA